ncbi:hypothetical protein [Kitasatospora viridis]|uniref:Uncharacterized protein n=1 Tax=Kitasatospora viridis TaxID=281105 RepID=A0A561UK93_9ACTN|nr:hypothetical protein [Kitasatospora viridis]TWF99784.1 hypothetical protein FHX73_113639 [Kitasatospora viridis]
MTDKGSGGSGYQIEVDSLRAFAGQVRGLLTEFQASADGKTAHAKSGVGRTSFGEFTEATALHDQYDVMRDGLRDALIALHQLIDDAQQKADLTATNYDEQERETTRSLKVTSDGWSVGAPATVVYAAAGAGGVVTGAAAGRSAAAQGAPVDGASDAAVVPPGPEGAVVPGAPVVPGDGGKGKSKREKPGQTGSTAPDGTELPSW